MATVLAILPVAGASFGSEILVALGVLAVASLVVALVLESPILVGLTVALLGLDYLLALEFAGAGFDPRAALVAAGLLLTSECAYWSFELRTPIHDERAVHLTRARAIGGLVVSGGVVALVPLLVAASAPFSGVLVAALGAGATVAIVAILVRLAWTSTKSPGLVTSERQRLDHISDATTGSRQIDPP